jgi:phosphotriesterase-related protein
VQPEAWIWVHANSERDRELHLKAARAGGWVEFDGAAEATIQQHIELVLALRRHDLLGRVLISQDAGWYHVGEPNGGHVRGYDLLFRRFLPALRKAGLTEDEVNRLVVDNPREAFTVRVRAAAG